jgi:chitinase
LQLLNASVVRGLQARGLKVFLSCGGGAGNVLPGAGAPAGFAASLLSGLSALVSEWGLDGIDFDLENWPGGVPDILAAAALVRAVIGGLRAAFPSLLISGAPQMTDAYCDYPSITAGFNRYAPLIAAAPPPPSPHAPAARRGSAAAARPAFDMLMPQMYNSWPAVETLAYAAAYAAGLAAGCAVSGGGGPAPLAMAVRGPWLGFPASRAAAGSGFQSPPGVVALYRALAANGSAPLGGLMTWSAGWDQQSGWQFAAAVAAG